MRTAYKGKTHETLKLHVRSGWGKWEAMELRLELEREIGDTEQDFGVYRGEEKLGVLERHPYTANYTTVGRLRYDHRDTVTWRMQRPFGEGLALRRDSRNQALGEILERTLGVRGMDIHQVGRIGTWKSCSICEKGER